MEEERQEARGEMVRSISNIQLLWHQNRKEHVHNSTILSSRERTQCCKQRKFYLLIPDGYIAHSWVTRRCILQCVCSNHVYLCIYIEFTV